MAYLSGGGVACRVDGVEDGKEEESRNDKDEVEPLVVELELYVSQHLQRHMPHSPQVTFVCLYFTSTRLTPHM